MDRSSAIVEATMHRLRPILLTGGGDPRIDPDRERGVLGPMAIAMMGGLFIATVLTLIFLPALYATWYRVPRGEAVRV